MTICGILFDAGDTLYGPIGGRWNPRFDFEQVLLRYHPEAPVDRFKEAFDKGKQFMDGAPSTPQRDDYHRAILFEIGICDPSLDLLAELNRPLDKPVVEVFRGRTSTCRIAEARDPPRDSVRQLDRLGTSIRKAWIAPVLRCVCRFRRDGMSKARS